MKQALEERMDQINKLGVSLKALDEEVQKLNRNLKSAHKTSLE